MAKQVAFANRMRSLEYDIDAMLALEAAAQKSTTQIILDLQVLSFSTIVLALWAGLRKDDPKLTPATVRKQLQNYVESPDADLRALRKAMQDEIEASAWYQQITKSDESGDDDVTGDDDGDEDDEGNPSPARVS